MLMSWFSRLATWYSTVLVMLARIRLRAVISVWMAVTSPFHCASG